MFIPTTYANHQGATTGQQAPVRSTRQEPEYPELDPVIAITILVVIVAGWFLFKRFRK